MPARMFQQLKNLTQAIYLELSTQCIMMDSEMSVLNAVWILSNPFCKTAYYNEVNLSLKPLYNDDSFYTEIHMLLALSFIPIHELQQTF